MFNVEEIKWSRNKKGIKIEQREESAVEKGEGNMIRS